MDKKKLEMWQERLRINKEAYQKELEKMDHREKLYAGSHEVRGVVEGDKTTTTPHVRNLIAENIESQISSVIPAPKVTARKKKYEWLAKLIEDWERNELDRMPTEAINDQMERTVKIQGGGWYYLEWDNSMRTHTTVGELTLAGLHPKMVIPQDGVYTGIEDMDYVFMEIPTTKEKDRRRFGVDLTDETETEPGVKGGDEDSAPDMVTNEIVLYRNQAGGIGIYVWVNDTELEDIEDYQARRLRRCRKCGALEPEDDVESAPPLTANGEMQEGKTHRTGRKGERKVCPYCGASDWEDTSEDYEELKIPVTRKTMNEDGELVEEQIGGMDADGNGLKIPYYKPNKYPLILQKNVSIHGQLLGDSDVDKIEDQQNTTNRLSAKILEKLVASGSYMTLPDNAVIETGTEECKIVRGLKPQDMQLFDIKTMEGVVAQDMEVRDQVYEESRQITGITDSFQGRHDATATSGKAKEFAAAQSAGRLESKRVMKQSAWADIFEAMFKFFLAYADEPRAVVSQDADGNEKYDEISRYDFLEQDANGDWYWNDGFLFSCDSAAPLASNREAMWQECRMNWESGAFGDPQDINARITFWSQMAKLHYPTAADIKTQLEEERKKQEEMQMQQMQLQQMQLQAQMQGAEMQAQQAARNNVRGRISSTIERARADAEQAARKAAQEKVEQG